MKGFSATGDDVTNYAIMNMQTLSIKPRNGIEIIRAMIFCGPPDIILS